MKKILRINLNNQTYAYEDIRPEYKNLGGRALTSKIIATEVDPKLDALAPENKLVFAPGLLGGTAMPNSGRLSIGSKSPLTHTIKEANSGGIAAIKTARLNLAAIILEGASPQLTNLKIDKDGVTFIPAEKYAGCGCEKAFGLLNEEYKGCAFAVNGPAGEKLMLASGIMVATSDLMARAAARGGLGAVMGSKRVKAVIIDDTGSKMDAAANSDLLKESVKVYTQKLMADPGTEGNKLLGTAGLVNFVNSFGGLITKNYSDGKWDKAENISGEAMAALIKSRPNGHTAHRCMPGCVIQCSNVFVDKDGNYVTSGLEYETLALVGSNCLIDDLDVIAKINGICNEHGLDTMDVGTALAVAMENGEIAWGDGAAAIKLVEECLQEGSKGFTIGIGNGCQYTGKKLGAKRIPTVKGQSLSGYDPRALKGTGVTYATATMGADHTCGNAMPVVPGYDPLTPEGQGGMSGFLQNFFAGVDSFGMCLFACLISIGNEENCKNLADAYAGLSGEDISADYLMQVGAQTVACEFDFNTKAGFTTKDDRLPEFFTKEVLPSTNQVFDVSEADLDAVHRG